MQKHLLMKKKKLKTKDKKGAYILNNKPLEKKDIVVPAKLRCLSCNKGFESVEFYDSDSELYGAIGKLPYCKECLDKIYRSHLAKYLDLNCMNPEQKALERICMSMDFEYRNLFVVSGLRREYNKVTKAP